MDKKLEELTLTEKKACAYDLIVQLETIQKTLQAVNQLIAIEQLNIPPTK